MKAVVVDVKGRFAAVLSYDGCVTRVPNRNYVIGQEIEMKKPKALTSVARIAAAACLACVLGLGGLGAYALYKTPFSYVSFDINPSVELGVNAVGRVVSVEYANKDGENILSGRAIINSDIKTAVERLVQSAIDKSYINEDGTSVVSVIVESKNQTRAARLADACEKLVNSAIRKLKREAVVYKNCSDPSLREQAKELGISPGKLMHIKALMALDPSATVEQYKDASVAVIIKKTHELIKALASNPDNADIDLPLNILDRVKKAAEKMENAEKKAEMRKEALKEAARAREEALKEVAEARKEALEKVAEARKEAIESVAKARKEALEKISEIRKEALKNALEKRKEAKTAQTSSDTDSQNG